VSFKLVRDRNQAWLQEHGVSGTWKTVSGDELAGAFIRKIGEEYAEYAEQRSPAELLDLLDAVVAALSHWCGEHPAEYADALRSHGAKVRLMGTFSCGVMWSPVPPGSLDKEVR
jgi:predicted house-cleaning noncanonical NTP pyrophosphatase (MazG superfamily)